MFEAHSQIFLALKFFGAGAAAMLGADVLLVVFAPFSARVKDIFRALIFLVFSSLCYYFLVVNLTFERVRGFLVASFALGTFVERKIFGKVLAIISLKVYNIFKEIILGVASCFKRAFAKIRQKRCNNGRTKAEKNTCRKRFHRGASSCASALYNGLSNARHKKQGARTRFHKSRNRRLA